MEAVRIAGMQVVHAIPRRARVKIARLGNKSEFAQEIRKRLAGVQGTQSIEANPVSESALMR